MDKIINLLGFKPKKLYYNLDLIEIQLKIKEQNREKAGVYMIYNKVNDKFYIGSATTNKINVKFRNHCIHGTGSKLMCQAIRKYGINNFAFVIIEYYPGFVRKENLDKNHLKLLELERKYTEELKPEYNISNNCISSLEYEEINEAKVKITGNYSIEQKVSFKNLGRSLNEFTKNLLSKLTKERNSNLELRKKLAKYSSKSIILYNIDFSIHSKYNSKSEMAKNFKCCRKTINKAINNNTIFKNIGFIKIDQNK